MSVRVFFNPDIVEQLAARGITARRSILGQGFVLATQRARRGREAATNVIAVRDHVTITGRRLISQATSPELALTVTEPQSALELLQECTRLRAEVAQLRRNNQLLLDEVSRLTTPSAPRQLEGAGHDDAVQRFALLELD